MNPGTQYAFWVHLAAAIGFAAITATGHAEGGAELFLKNCQACHTSGKGEPQRQGPNLWGVVGRTAGTVKGFKYSDALKSSAIVWTPEQMDAWLTFPQIMVRGTIMVSRQSDPDTRKAIIDYLTTLKD